MSLVGLGCSVCVVVLIFVLSPFSMLLLVLDVVFGCCLVSVAVFVVCLLVLAVVSLFLSLCSCCVCFRYVFWCWLLCLLRCFVLFVLLV